MGTITTVGSKPKTVITHEDSYGINFGLFADAALPKGAIVKLLANGKVGAVAAVTDIPLGILSVGCDAANDKVTVITGFKAITVGLADGVVATGAQLNALSLDATTQLMNYKTHASTNPIVGVALVGGADNAEIYVGIY